VGSLEVGTRTSSRVDLGDVDLKTKGSGGGGGGWLKVLRVKVGLDGVEG
jgi:hypothetical protein